MYDSKRRSRGPQEGEGDVEWCGWGGATRNLGGSFAKEKFEWEELLLLNLR